MKQLFKIIRVKSHDGEITESKRHRWVWCFTSILHRVAICCLIVAAGLFSMTANATNCTVPATQINFPGPVKLDNRVAIGALLTQWIPVTVSASCTKDSQYAWQVSHRIYTTLGQIALTVNDGGVTYNVYNTGTPGVGIAVGFVNVDKGGVWENMTSSGKNTALTVPDNTLSTVTMITNTPPAYVMTLTYKAILVKIATVNSGTVILGPLQVVNYYSVWYYKVYSNSDWASSQSGAVTSNLSVAPVSIDSTPPTCTVTQASANQTVGLGYTGTDKFKGVGTTVGKTPFSLNLQNCYNYPVVSLTLNGTADGDLANAAENGVLASTGRASGIGVQILDNSASGNAAPIPLNAPWAAGTVKGSGVSDTMSIPLAARYIQTKSQMGPGNVAATATIQFTYQ